MYYVVSICILTVMHDGSRIDSCNAQLDFFLNYSRDSATRWVLRNLSLSGIGDKDLYLLNFSI
jgi:hypothetical protein